MLDGRAAKGVWQMGLRSAPCDTDSVILAQDENWQVLTTLLPKGWRGDAFASGAIERMRGFATVSDLLRTLLLHVGNGYFLRETATRAKAAGLAAVSDVAILDRLRTAGPWWRRMCARLLEECTCQHRLAVGCSVPSMAR